MKAIFLKELRTYFKNPLGYVFIGMMLVILGFYYTFYTMYYQYADYYHVLNAGSSLILFVVPVLTMRIMSEEAKNKTDQLLLTAPIKTSGIVIGKFMAAAVIYGIVLLISTLQPLVTVFFFDGEMSVGMTLGGYIGFLLLGLAFISIGMFISSLTENQLIAAVVTIGVFSLLNLTEGIQGTFPTSRYFSLFVLIGLAIILLAIIYRAIRDIKVTGIVGAGLLVLIGVTFLIWPASYEGLIATIMSSLSIFERYANMFYGLFDFGHIVFFISLIIFFLYVTYQVVEKKRWS